ncbi:MAG: T9SS type A sorting domain-containing protein [Bacteroidales bacterium]
MKKLFLITFLFVFSLNLNAQKWEKKYFTKEVALKRNITESYDHGFLLSAFLGEEGIGVLCKMDINGQPLWEKRIINANGKSRTLLLNHTEDRNGNIYLCGEVISLKENEFYDPFVAKLNSCGEVVWSKIFRTPDRNDDCADKIALLSNGNLIVSISYNHPLDSEGVNRISLYCFNPEGDLLWRHYYDSESFFNENITDMQVLPGDRILVTSWAEFILNTEKVAFYLSKVYTFMTGSDGELKWTNELLKDKNTGEGDVLRSLCGQIAPSGKNLYYSLGRCYYKDKYYVYNTVPGLMKLDLKGKLKGMYNMVEPDETEEWGIFSKFVFADNNKIIGAYAMNPIDNRRENYLDQETENISEFPIKRKKRQRPDNYKAVIIDTLGKIQKEVLMDIGLPSVIKTSDNKYLFAGTYNISCSKPEDPSVHLYKFTGDLEYAPLCTESREYDYLCDSPVNTETIDLNDYEIVNVEEFSQGRNIQRLKAFPNPVASSFKLELPLFIQKQYTNGNISLTQQQFKYQSNSILEVINIEGKKVYSQTLNVDQKEIYISSVNWEKGIYLLRLISGNHVVGKVKLVK